MNICIHCTHYLLELNGYGKETHRCKHPDLQNVDRVTGKQSMPECYTVRSQATCHWYKEQK